MTEFFLFLIWVMLINICCLLRGILEAIREKK